MERMVTSDPELRTLQDNVAAAVEPIEANPLSDGVLLQGVTLAVGANEVAHRLGRVLQGWFPVRVRAAATFYDSQDSNTHPERTLRLVASAAVTVDLFVF